MVFYIENSHRVIEEIFKLMDKSFTLEVNQLDSKNKTKAKYRFIGTSISKIKGLDYFGYTNKMSEIMELKIVCKYKDVSLLN